MPEELPGADVLPFLDDVEAAPNAVQPTRDHHLGEAARPGMAVARSTSTFSTVTAKAIHSAAAA